MLERLGIREPRAFREFCKVADIFSEIDYPHVASTHDRFYQYLPQSIAGRIRKISLEHWPDIDITHHVPDDVAIQAIANRLSETL